MVGLIDVDDLSDEEIERIVNTPLFRKGLAYRRLADGIEVLEDEDEIFDSLVRSIEKQHSRIGTEKSIRDVLRLFKDEVEAFTAPLVDDEEDVDVGDIEDLYEEGST